jgi:cell division protein ZapA
MNRGGGSLDPLGCLGDDGAVSRSVKVTVAGQTLAIRTDARPGYVRELAELVDAKIAEVRSSTRAVSTQAVALLAALNLADELQQLRDSQRELKRRVRERSERILRYLDTAET